MKYKPMVALIFILSIAAGCNRNGNNPPQTNGQDSLKSGEINNECREICDSYNRQDMKTCVHMCKQLAADNLKDFKQRFSKLVEQEEAMRRETKALIEKKRRLTEQQVHNSQSIEGRKDQMHKTGTFEGNEVPIIINKPDNNSNEVRKDQMHKTGAYEENEVPIIMSEPENKSNTK
jgi:hypothetical protein